MSPSSAPRSSSARSSAPTCRTRSPRPSSSPAGCPRRWASRSTRTGGRRPLPPAAVAELCRAGRTPLDGLASGARVKLFEPDWQDDPVDFLAAACAEFAQTGVVVTARRCLAVVETADPVMFVGVELSLREGDLRALPLAALERAATAVPTPWPVNLVLLDVTDDPVANWMREQVRPFYTGDHL